MWKNLTCYRYRCLKCSTVDICQVIICYSTIMIIIILSTIHKLTDMLRFLVFKMSM